MATKASCLATTSHRKWKFRLRRKSLRHSPAGNSREEGLPGPKAERSFEAKLRGRTGTSTPSAIAQRWGGRLSPVRQVAVSRVLVTLHRPNSIDDHKTRLQVLGGARGLTKPLSPAAVGMKTRSPYSLQDPGPTFPVVLALRRLTGHRPSGTSYSRPRVARDQNGGESPRPPR